MNGNYDLTPKERALLREHLRFYRSLDGGERIAETDAQVHFVEVCRGRAKPRTPHESAYLKHRAVGGGDQPPALLSVNAPASTFIPTLAPKDPPATKKKKQKKKRAAKQPSCEFIESARTIRARRNGWFDRLLAQPTRPTPPNSAVLSQLRDLVSQGRIDSPQGAALANLRFGEVKPHQWQLIAQLVHHAIANPKVEHKTGQDRDFKVYRGGEGSDLSEYGNLPRPDWFRDEDWKKVGGRSHYDG